MNGTMTASEAVYGFAAWLTCRQEAVTLGAAHNAATAAELVKRWCDTNKLPPPRDGVYSGNITQPEPTANAPPHDFERSENIHRLVRLLASHDF
jgi:hypothetical protein